MLSPVVASPPDEALAAGHHSELATIVVPVDASRSASTERDAPPSRVREESKNIKLEVLEAEARILASYPTQRRRGLADVQMSPDLRELFEERVVGGGTVTSDLRLEQERCKQALMFGHKLEGLEAWVLAPNVSPCLDRKRLETKSKKSESLFSGASVELRHEAMQQLNSSMRRQTGVYELLFDDRQIYSSVESLESLCSSETDTNSEGHQDEEMASALLGSRVEEEAPPLSPAGVEVDRALEETNEEAWATEAKEVDDILESLLEEVASAETTAETGAPGSRGPHATAVGPVVPRVVVRLRAYGEYAVLSLRFVDSGSILDASPRQLHGNSSALLSKPFSANPESQEIRALDARSEVLGAAERHADGRWDDHKPLTPDESSSVWTEADIGLFSMERLARLHRPGMEKSKNRCRVKEMRECKDRVEKLKRDIAMIRNPKLETERRRAQEKLAYAVRHAIPTSRRNPSQERYEAMLRLRKREAENECAAEKQGLISFWNNEHKKDVEKKESSKRESRNKELTKKKKELGSKQSMKRESRRKKTKKNDESIIIPRDLSEKERKELEWRMMKGRMKMSIMADMKPFFIADPVWHACLAERARTNLLQRNFGESKVHEESGQSSVEVEAETSCDMAKNDTSDQEWQCDSEIDSSLSESCYDFEHLLTYRILMSFAVIVLLALFVMLCLLI